MYKGKHFNVLETPQQQGSPENPPDNTSENPPENASENPHENASENPLENPPENDPENPPEPEPEVFMQTNNGCKYQACHITINQCSYFAYNLFPQSLAGWW